MLMHEKPITNIALIDKHMNWKKYFFSRLPIDWKFELEVPDWTSSGAHKIMPSQWIKQLWD